MRFNPRDLALARAAALFRPLLSGLAARRTIAKTDGEAGGKARRAPLRARRDAAILAVAVAVMTAMAADHARAAAAGGDAATPLIIAEAGKSDAVIVLSPTAGRYERQAAEDLAKYIALMTGAAPSIARTREAIDAALSSVRPLLLLGQAALAAKPQLSDRLAAIIKQKPDLRADGVVLLREANKVYLAGSNDESHYFAAAELLRAWGVRWFMPGEFGECVPQEQRLAIGDLAVVYAPPSRSAPFGSLGSEIPPARKISSCAI